MRNQIKQVILEDGRNIFVDISEIITPNKIYSDLETRFKSPFN